MKNLHLLFLMLLSTYCFSQNEQKGKQFIDDLFLNKNYDSAHSYFDTTLSAYLSKEQLTQGVEQIESQLGKFKKIIEVNQSSNTFYFYSEFEHAKIDIQLSFNDLNKVIGFLVKPHKEIRKEISNKDFIINSNGIDIKGTLLVPKDYNRKKLVVFLHGSGPQDRDETIYNNKPFKDIAEGLLSKGIASYRFDKRSLTNPESFSQNSTIDDEYTVDVLNIINYFKTNELYKDYEIIILGHSLGGYIIPRIFNMDNRIAKLVFLAPNARSLDELLIEQYEYLLNLNPNSNDLKKEVEEVKEKVAFLHSKSFINSVPQEKLPLGLPYNYWKSILEYKPLTEVKRITVPILVLHGERDYQVTTKDIELWKKNIKVKNAKFISYPKLNHLFMEGTGIPTPQEYAIRNNVAPEVIDDICNFILN